MIFVQIKVDSEYPFFRPFSGHWFGLLLLPLLLTFLLEKYFSKYITLLRYIRFITVVVMIGLLIMSLSDLYEGYSGLYQSFALFIDYLLTFIIIVLLIGSLTLENTYYENKRDKKLFIKEFRIMVMLTLGMVTLYAVEFVLVMLMAILGIGGSV
jgi:hypothetical protein